jgi:phytoene dehydrogenase-like protein
MGGLTSAALMAKAGLRTLVLEHHFALGGNTQCFRRKKMFDFDVGLHYIGDCGPGGLYTAVMGQMGLAGKVEFVPMDPDGFDTLIYPDFRFRVPAGWEKYESRLKEAFPEEARAIERFVGVMRALAGRRFGGPSPEIESSNAVSTSRGTPARWARCSTAWSAACVCAASSALSPGPTEPRLLAPRRPSTLSSWTTT